jgi:lipopolysaccharide transport protein LptA
LWQGSNLLQAERLDLDRRAREMEAQGKVYSVIPQQPGTERNGPVEIQSERMLYKETTHTALYRGKVRMRSESSGVNSEQLEVYFAPAARGSRDDGVRKIERAVGSGEVVVLDSGRKATADKAEYLPGQSLFHLTGKPATVSDPERGVVQGVRLTYRIADDRILVEGEPGIPAETRRQVQR